jgi:hypothetical protein
MACGERSAIVQWRTRADTGGVDRYHVSILTDDGRVRFQDEGRAAAALHPARMEAFAHSRDMWYFYTNDDERGPAVHLVRIPVGDLGAAGRR